jgi:hypothetical protein
MMEKKMRSLLCLRLFPPGARCSSASSKAGIARSSEGKHLRFADFQQRATPLLLFFD